MSAASVSARPPWAPPLVKWLEGMTLDEANPVPRPLLSWDPCGLD